MDIDSDTLGIPDTEYDVRVKMPSGEFARIVRDLSALGESVKIDVSKDGVRFSAEGEAANGNILLKPTESVRRSKPARKADGKGKKTKVKTEEGDEDGDDDEVESEEEGDSKKEKKKTKVKKEEGGSDVEMVEDDDDDDGEAKPDEDGGDDDDDSEPTTKKRKKAPSKVRVRLSWLFSPPI